MEGCRCHLCAVSELLPLAFFIMSNLYCADFFCSEFNSDGNSE